MKDKLIEDIKNFTHSYDRRYKYYTHKNFIDALSMFLGENNYKVILNSGKIDLCVSNDQITIAIEYDNEKKLKYHSISKLLLSKSEFKIAIIRGDPKNISDSISNAKERISFIKEKLQIKNQEIILIIASEKI